MFVSLDGILSKHRIKCRRDLHYMHEEFLKHYAQAKKANSEGDKETVDSFFKLYVVD